MLQRILNIDGLQGLIDALAESGHRVIGPRVEEGVVVLAPLRSVDELPAGWVDEQSGGRYRLKELVTEEGIRPLFAHLVGPHAWKRFLHPPREVLWRARRETEGLAFEVEAPKPSRFAFLGVRACDLAAMLIQDRVLMEGAHVDVGYARRRRESFILAVNCMRSADSCFCASMGSGPQVGAGHDLLLTELVEGGDHRFLLEAGSESGERLLAPLPGRSPLPEELAARDRLVAEAACGQQGGMPAGSSRILGENLEHPHWEAVAARCLHCGNCTSVCPTCFCTRMDAVTSLDGTTAEQRRSWDSCFNEAYSHLHGGALRHGIAARYRQWLIHKLLHWQDQFGTPGCTGCGRCITWCPVGIDMREEVRALEEARP